MTRARRRDCDHCANGHDRLFVKQQGGTCPECGRIRADYRSQQRESKDDQIWRRMHEDWPWWDRSIGAFRRACDRAWEEDWQHDAGRRRELVHAVHVQLGPRFIDDMELANLVP